MNGPHGNVSTSAHGVNLQQDSKEISEIHIFDWHHWQHNCRTCVVEFSFYKPIIKDALLVYTHI